MKETVINKITIFNTAREVIRTFTKEEKEKLAGVYINVIEDGMTLDYEHKEVMGRYVKAYHTIDYFLFSIIAHLQIQEKSEREIKFKSVIEHELLHALGLDHDGIKAWRKKKGR